jgi:protein ImuA
MTVETAQHPLVLARLRDEIRRLERRPDRRPGTLACGLASVDEALPGGGFPRGVLSELRGGPSSGKTAVALSLVAALSGEELAAFVDGTGELYPPAAAALGVDLGRLLVVRPAAPAPGVGGPLAGFWAAEALLASGAFAAVVIDVPLPARLRGGAEATLRRLQTAAERGGTIGLWLSAPGAAARVPAGIRLDLALREGRVVAKREGWTAGARAGGGGHAA